MPIRKKSGNLSYASSTWNHIIVYKLLILDKNSWKYIIVRWLFVLDGNISNHLIVYRLLVLDTNTWNYLTVYGLLRLKKNTRCSLVRINFIYCGLFVLILVVFVFFLLSLHFGQISPLAFFRWFLQRPRIGMLSPVTVSPVITAFHSCCLSHHFFDQVNLWPAWVGFETAIFWQCSPGTVETQHLYPLCHGPLKIKKPHLKMIPIKDMLISFLIDSLDMTLNRIQWWDSVVEFWGVRSNTVFVVTPWSNSIRSGCT